MHSWNWPNDSNNWHTKGASKITQATSGLYETLLCATSVLLLDQKVWCSRLQNMQTTKTSKYCMCKTQLLPWSAEKISKQFYQDFSDIWGKNTSEKDRPSLASSKKGKDTLSYVCRNSMWHSHLWCVLETKMCIFQKKAHKKWMHSTSVLQSRSSLQLWGHNHTWKLWTVDIVLPWTSWWVYWWCCCYHCRAFGDLQPITVELKHNYVSNCAPCLQWVLWLWEKGMNQRPTFFCRQNIF